MIEDSALSLANRLAVRLADRLADHQPCCQPIITMNILTGNLTFDSLRPPDLSSCTKAQLRDYFENGYDLNESLFTALRDESVFYTCPDRLRLPLIFYFAHTAVVYINKLILAGLLEKRVNMEFETMFETGVDEMSWDDTENYRMGGSYQWPSLDEVIEYRRAVRNVILKVIKDTPLQLPVTKDSQWWALLMGMEHARLHLETSSVLIRQLPVTMVTKPNEWIYGPLKQGENVSSNPLITVHRDEVTFGKPDSFPSFGWDNEYGEMTDSVPTFEASKFPVTNGQFMKFVEDGGYTNRTFWTCEGWEWRSFRQARHPTFWICDKGCKSGCGSALSSYSHCSQNNNNNYDVVPYRYRAMFDEITMPLDWPVDVTYHEAHAYCAWKGPDFRLPTEAEYIAMRGSELPTNFGVQSDIIFQENSDANINLLYGSSTPVNMNAASDLGFHDLHGNIWEWTDDHFNGFNGFEPHFLYDDFSTTSFDGRHNTILNGSWISTGSSGSKFTRIGFRRHFMQHCGFRVARSLPDTTEKVVIPAVILDTVLFIPGIGDQEIPETINMSKYMVTSRRSSNSQYDFDKKEALAMTLKHEFGDREALPYVVADLCRKYTRTLRCGTTSAAWFGSGSGRGPMLLSNTFNKFTWIPNEIGKHNLVVMTFLERTITPKAWLVRMWEIIEDIGIVVIVSEDTTFGQDALAPHLGNRLKCVYIEEIPYEKHGGKCVAMVTVWSLKC
ncbi:LOW QUALITY PROTEIN: ergothioneine biosynthesis protein 1-like [Pecten maximus]|uniref:LOW QUALITY PROTEIN: ergothioneine biosynthesis protein 1-like n=1 Tax=Pecten maximus TaxID=6579 RepID=UPI001457F019|nr:LOW QUALITY PROTEIN: ergothioneine biosynthesis protein 1-like [Pecten maximus]